MSGVQGPSPVAPIGDYSQQLKDLDKQLGNLKSKVESNTKINTTEVSKLIKTMEGCSEPKVFQAVAQGTDSKLIDQLLKSINFFQSKAAQETVAPAIVSLFKSSLTKLKSTLSKPKKKLKKVEKVAKGEKGDTGSRFK